MGEVYAAIACGILLVIILAVNLTEFEFRFRFAISVRLPRRILDWLRRHRPPVPFQPEPVPVNAAAIREELARPTDPDVRDVLLDQLIEATREDAK